MRVSEKEGIEHKRENGDTGDAGQPELYTNHFTDLCPHSGTRRG